MVRYKCSSVFSQLDMEQIHVCAVEDLLVLQHAWLTYNYLFIVIFPCNNNNTGIYKAPFPKITKCLNMRQNKTCLTY